MASVMTVVDLKASATMDLGYNVFMCTAAAGSWTLNLASAKTNEGASIYLKRTDSAVLNTITLVPMAGETVNAAVSLLLVVGQTIRLLAHNSAWVLL